MAGHGRQQLAVILLFMLTGRAAAKTYQYDTAALITLYNGISNPELLKGWNSMDACGYNSATTTPTPWLGVTCNGQTSIDGSNGGTYDQVTGLDLKGLGLAGNVSFGEDYRALNYLATVDLSDNNFNGSLPDLSSAYAIKDLDVSNNQFTGTIPNGWNSLAKLSKINVANNQLSGALPAAITTLKNMTELNVAGNLFSGDIPGAFDRTFTLLSSLNFSSNLFGNGTNPGIPPTLSTVPALRTLDLSNNALGGSIPPAFNNFPMLTYLRASNCSLTGTFPEMTNVTSLLTLDFSYNQIAGQLPAAISLMSQLQYVRFDHNQFTGSLPTAVTSLVNLQQLCVNNNQLSGNIPTGFGTNAKNLQEFGFHDNLFSGSIPMDFVVLGQRLKSLQLQNNLLTGTIPDLSALSAMQILDLSNNQFTGPLPASLATIQQLGKIKLSKNRLNGTIPNAYRNMSLLNDLEVDSNQLGGPLPTWLGRLKFANLAGNQFTGGIPSGTFAGASQLVALSLADNRLGGQLPFSLGLQSTLFYLDLSGNAFTASGGLDGVKQPLSGLTAMEVLKLSSNKFTGNLPSFVTKLPRLIDLELAGNHFTGNIPASWSHFSKTVARIDISENFLTGQIPSALLSITPQNLILSPGNDFCALVPGLPCAPPGSPIATYPPPPIPPVLSTTPPVSTGPSPPAPPYSPPAITVPPWGTSGTAATRPNWGLLAAVLVGCLGYLIVVR